MGKKQIKENMEGQNYNQTKGIVYNISTYKPEQCGIASWTEDKINYSHKVDPSFRNRVVASNGFRSKNEYADVVDFCIDKDVLDDYLKAAEFINNQKEAKVVSLQHEFGIYGGQKVDSKPIGDYVLKFMDAIEKPIVTTCHTAYDTPLESESKELFSKRKETLGEILKRSDKVVAISETSGKILVDHYGADKNKINIVLHGVHDFQESQEVSRKILGLEDRIVMSMVGLVRKKRGMEHVIRSLPEVVEKYPKLLFVLAGKTHPKEFESDGSEPYRNFLKNEVSRLNLEKNVSFVNRFLPLESLLRYIQASDFCITPYTDPRQVSSGVLSYSVGLGKPVISTPFTYAKEILGGGKGIILPDFNNPESMSQGILDLLGDKEKIISIKKNLAEIQEKMNWKNVAKKYVDVEKSVIRKI